MSLPEKNLSFAFAFGHPTCSAKFRVCPEDFIVVEALGFEPSGDGEHVYLAITKISQNTHWVAQRLADFAKVKSMDVGYCGRKDRHAQTKQWFSVYLPGQQQLDWRQCQIEGVEIHSVDRHTHKLRPGQHQYNHFEITLRELSNVENLKSRFRDIRMGIPNYFGEQRFGRDGNNLREAERWAEGSLKMRGKKQRGLYISTLRSYLFNCVLSQRITDNTWQQRMDGDIDGDEPTGPLWGRGRSLVNLATQACETHRLDGMAEICRALEHCGLSQARRDLICHPQNLDLQQLDTDSAKVSMTLTPGQYATSILRELVYLDNMAPSH